MRTVWDRRVTERRDRELDEARPATRVSQTIDRIDTAFDDPNLVANAGLVLVATLSRRLGLQALVEAAVRLVGRVGGALRAHPCSADLLDSSAACGL